MKQAGEVRISYWAAHLTTIVSVTLVLVLAGLIAMATAGARRESKRLLEKLEVNVIMADSVSDRDALATAGLIGNAPFAVNVDLVSGKQALENWKQATGEDLEALFGVNPLSPEISFTIPSEYASASQLDTISARLSSLPGVGQVVLPDSKMVDGMNANISRISVVLGVIALVMLIISFVLINNTVHLAVYARRFTIHTMQLVGATDAFIRRPYISDGILSGFLAGVFASAILVAAVSLSPYAGLGDIAGIIGWGAMSLICASLTVLGISLCAVASAMATTKYLHQDYNELFK